jgi:predicted DNA-binding transcriptional regulator AlpA
MMKIPNEDDNVGEGPPMVRLKDFAAEISVSVRQIYRMIQSGKIPRPLKQGARSYFLRTDLEDYLKRLKEQRS